MNGARIIVTIGWHNATLALAFRATADSPVALESVTLAGRRIAIDHPIGLVHVLTAAHGHVPASNRLVGTAIGADLRLVGHEVDDRGSTCLLVLEAAEQGIRAEVRLEGDEEIAAVRLLTTVTNIGRTTLLLRSVTSWAAGLAGTDRTDPVGDWTLTYGRNDWLGEGRWSSQPIAALFPAISEKLTGHNPRGGFRQSSRGTWSTAAALPYALLHSQDARLAWMWQIEHNGAWRWDVGQDTDGSWFAGSGPGDDDAAWVKVLEPGESFTAVPMSVALGAAQPDAVAAMTQHRRQLRRDHPDNAAMSVVFNDYMNTLDGNPTTDKLLPLIEAAADAGAEIFCIDAGWYDDTGAWWDTVGEWLPSQTRFPGGLGEVIDHIRSHGMAAGLWLEPEVVGVNSPAAATLPPEAFFSRHGLRVVEHDRYHLDLRHPAAVAHLDAVVDRLVAEFGVGFFKFDYNIDPATGSDRDADSTGDALLEHNRAQLAWIDALLDRHPDLVVENCSSGAMRTDPALLRRLAMQSTSDQQDFLKYPPIAASAPLAMLPEQAASWAYPQPGMTAEESAYCLVTGLLGRYYVSGFVNEMSPDTRALVAEAIAVAKVLRKELPQALPMWPGGLPGWEDQWISLGLTGDQGFLLSVWHRGDEPRYSVHLPQYKGQELEIQVVFPLVLPAWDVDWDPASAALTFQDAPPVSARTFRILPATVRRQASPVIESTARPDEVV